MAETLGHAGNSNSDARVCGLSTILVATIQETKDKIAQVEYLFCSQLYPEFQARSKSLMKMYADAKEEAEQTWEDSEKNLLLQIERLQSDRQEALGENKLLRLDGDKLLEMQNTARSQESRISELEQKLMRKSREIDEGLKMQNRLIQLVQAKSRVIVEKEKQLRDHEAARASQARLKSTEEDVAELKSTLMDTAAKLKTLEEKCSSSSSIGMKPGEGDEEDEEGRASRADLIERLEESERRRECLEVNTKKQVDELLQQMKLKDSEMLMAGKKKGEMVDAYKRLKSQYNFLCTKLELGKEITHPKKKAIVAPTEAGEMEMEKQNRGTCGCDEQAAAKSTPLSIFRNPSPTAKSVSVIGAKRTSSWIETKPNPEEEFLDATANGTRESSARAVEEKTKDQAEPVRHASASSRSENAEGDERSNPGGDGFKYVAPVRKKADRENLRGAECKQCKKFYDAVLPSCGEGNYRCEHLDAVSRHRYRHLPPLTPEGFWDIGFDTET